MKVPMISALPTIGDALVRMKRGELTSRELVEYCARRIEQFEDRIHAWVAFDLDAARREAARFDEMARSGEFAGVLHGIPIGVKDIIDVAGWPTKAGSPLRANHRAQHDAPVVERLRKAGAIILGKTVTTEFACFDPPPTRNPWNLNHTPGGSSSGSAAAVALEMCVAAVGSQTGGSITRPASFCGVAGLKPSHGQIPLDGIVPISPRLDHVGPIARHAIDLACMYSTLADQTKANVSPLRLPPKLVVIEEFFLETADDAVRQVTIDAIRRVSGGGDVLRLALPPSFEKLATMHRRIMAVDAAEYHRESFARNRDQYGPHVAALIEEGLATSPSDYASAVAHQRLCQWDFAALLGDMIAITPATRTTAPASLDTTGDPAFNAPWSYTGLPTVSIPCGLADDGMPCSLQLIGGPSTEAALLAAAGWCETRLDFRRRPPMLETTR